MHNKGAKHRRTAPTARAARVYVLLFAVENNKPAVAVATAYVYPLSFKQFIKQICADIAQISGKDNVIILRACSRITEKLFYGASCGGGKCQENTINFPLLKFSFNNAGLEHLWCVGCYRRVDVKQTPYSNFVVYFSQKAIGKFDIKFCGRKFFS